MVWVLSQRAANGPAESLNAVCSSDICDMNDCRNCPRKEALEPNTNCLPWHGRVKKSRWLWERGDEWCHGWHNLFCIIYLFIGCSVFTAAHGPSLVAVSGGSSPAAVCGLLAAVASLVAECRLQGKQVSVVVVLGLWGAGSVTGTCGLSCSAACVIFPDGVLNLCPGHRKEDS